MKKWIVTFIICIAAFSASTANAMKNTVKPDNTAVNKEHELTAQDQSNKKADVEITRKIRSQITKTRNLSLYAKNVKIIVRDADVTLKGPVNSLAEKAKIVEIATTIAPNHRVHNQLVVTR